jgi:hypothetical protein
MQFQVSTREKNPSCTAIHTNAPLSQESTQQDISKTTNVSQIIHNIKENVESNHRSSQSQIHYINMTIADVVRASR